MPAHLRSGARFSKVPELSGRVSGDIKVLTLIEKDHLGDRSPEKDCC